MSIHIFFESKFAKIPEIPIGKIYFATSNKQSSMVLDILIKLLLLRTYNNYTHALLSWNSLRYAVVMDSTCDIDQV